MHDNIVWFGYSLGLLCQVFLVFGMKCYSINGSNGNFTRSSISIYMEGSITFFVI